MVSAFKIGLALWRNGTLLKIFNMLLAAFTIVRYGVTLEEAARHKILEAQALPDKTGAEKFQWVIGQLVLIFDSVPKDQIQTVVQSLFTVHMGSAAQPQKEA